MVLGTYERMVLAILLSKKDLTTFQIAEEVKRQETHGKFFPGLVWGLFSGYSNVTKAVLLLQKKGLLDEHWIENGKRRLFRINERGRAAPL